MVALGEVALEVVRANGEHAMNVRYQNLIEE
jgi:hypothetical protein